MIKVGEMKRCGVRSIRIVRRLRSAKSTKQDSVRNVVIVLTSLSVVSAAIQSFTACSEVNVSYGKCLETVENKRVPLYARGVQNGDFG